MAAAKKGTNKRRRSGGGGGGLPGWAMLTIGLVIGLFVAFLVYLDDLEPQETDRISVEDADEMVPEDEDDRPRFEFYSILPELEVVIPEFGGDSDPDDSGGAEAGDADEMVEPPVESPDGTPNPDGDGGSYFLQVGSFQEEDKADELKAEIALLGLDTTIRTIEVDGDDWHRVRVGPFDEQDALESAQDRLRNEGIDYLVLRASAE